MANSDAVQKLRLAQETAATALPATGIVATGSTFGTGNGSTPTWKQVIVRSSPVESVLFPPVVLSRDHLAIAEASTKPVGVMPSVVREYSSMNTLPGNTNTTTGVDNVQQFDGVWVSGSKCKISDNYSAFCTDNFYPKAKYSETFANRSVKLSVNNHPHHKHQHHHYGRYSVHNKKIKPNCEYDVNSSTKSAYSSSFVHNVSISTDLCLSGPKKPPWQNKRPHHHEPNGAPGSSKWLRILKPQFDLLGTDPEECWPPLAANLASSSNKHVIRDEELQISSPSSSSSQCDTCSECDTCSLCGIDRGNTAMVLDEECWPSLEKSGATSNRISVQPVHRSNDDIEVESPRAASPSSSSSSGDEGSSKTTNKSLSMPPVLLMVNKDFIVTSPLKQNLLLTVSLSGKRSAKDSGALNNSQDTHAPVEGQPMITRRHILVGQFKAISSFIHFVLGQDAMRVRTETNAGGTSTISESLSVEYFVRRFQARDIVTEMEVEYRSFNWKKVDYICTLYGQRVGVSVTRAMSFPDPKDFTSQMAYRLLHKKLFGLVVARHGVSDKHSFSQCILHVWCETQEAASIIEKQYEGVSQELDIADDVIMVLTVADGWHSRPIFYESSLSDSNNNNKVSSGALKSS